jgi:hypothetical protein
MKHDIVWLKDQRQQSYVKRNNPVEPPARLKLEAYSKARSEERRLISGRVKVPCAWCNTLKIVRRFESKKPIYFCDSECHGKYNSANRKR